MAGADHAVCTAPLGFPVGQVAGQCGGCASPALVSQLVQARLRV